MDHPLVPLDLLTPEEEEALIAAMVSGDDGEAARSHLEAGNPIYYVAPDTPPGVVEKLFPDGRRQYIRVDLDGEHLVTDNVQTVSIPCADNPASRLLSDGDASLAGDFSART